jgi:Mrp family chromosome partitioning ATPase
MMKGNVKDVFPGGNTSLGFYSYYDYVIGVDACRIMVIKGGPGTGKSSLMRKIAVQMVESGFDAELHHCSSDNNSLDGVVFPQIRVAIIDGTSPHIVDPKNPGAVDEIIHLGDYWDEAGIRRHRAEIIQVNQKVGKLFQRAYRFLQAAKVIHDDLENLNGEGLNYGEANIKAATLKKQICGDLPVARRTGFLRKLFASAITPDGFINFLPNIMQPVERVYLVKGGAGTGKATLLGKIAAAAVERGCYCEGYYCAFDPVKLEHLVIPELGVALTTAVEPHLMSLDSSKTTIIDLNDCLNSTVGCKDEAAIGENQQLIAALFEKAFAHLYQAKVAHDAMEQYYIPNMDFAAIAKLGERTLERILNYDREDNQKGI